MDENINLCEILKGHEGETFYSPLIGNITLNKIREEYAYPLMFISRGLPYHFTSDGKYNIDNVECLLFPSKGQRDWNKWIEEQEPKVPKTWSEFIEKDNRAMTYNLEVTYNEYQPHSTSYTPIEKSALTLLKIHQLIEVGYGGNITNEEWDIDSNVWCYSILYNVEDSEFVIVSDVYHKSIIAFHTEEQAEEFLKYPENIQLLKDYFMI